MIAALGGAIFVLIAGITMLLDNVDDNDEIGKFFTGSGVVATLVLGVMMLGGAS